MLQLVQSNSMLPSSRTQTLQTHLLGHLEYAEFERLQQRLVFDAASRADGRITLLICEHPPIITLGSEARPDDVEPRGVLLAGRGVDAVEARRGGGAMLHAPGQLGVYVIAPLDWYRWSIG
ncbi:MAG: hypothetical protein KDA42_16140, partial [Planctomycetales bacterium]|nr:hypothetical protein [Planctomycetales bacterium]